MRSTAPALVEAAGLLVLERPPPDAHHGALSVARLTGLLTATLGVLYIVLGIYRETADRLRLRWFEWLAAAGRRPLVVICGLGRIGRQLAAQLLSGWRYGPHDNAGKRRESLIAWHHLPEEERVKDLEQIEELAKWLVGRPQE